jgi:tetratricopeptide (TPR) repeat protein
MKKESDEALRDATELCNDDRELEAEVLVKERLAEDPDNLDLMTKLGVIQSRLCNDYEAEATFRAVLVRNPNHQDAICGLGRILDQSLRTEEAEQLYTAYLSRNPTGHCALEDLCRLLLSEGQTDRAIQLARDQIQKYGNTSDAFDALRYVLQILEDDLDDELSDDRENEGLYISLMNNLLEQVELVDRIQRLGDFPEELQADLDDDRTRLLCEIENLVKSAPSRNIHVSDEILHRIAAFKS